MWIYTWLCMLQRAGLQADRVKRAVSCQPRCVLNLSCFVMCPCGQCRQCQARVFLKWQQLLAVLFSAFKLLSAKTHFALKGKPTIQALQYPSSVQVTCSWTHLCPLHTKESLLQRERERGRRETVDSTRNQPAGYTWKTALLIWHRDLVLSSLVARKISGTNLTKQEKSYTAFVYNACSTEKGCKSLKKQNKNSAHAICNSLAPLQKFHVLRHRPMGNHMRSRRSSRIPWHLKIARNSFERRHFPQW